MDRLPRPPDPYNINGRKKTLNFLLSNNIGGLINSILDYCCWYTANTEREDIVFILGVR